MAIRLLKTKLYIPPAPLNLLHRKRLIHLLEQGLQRKLTLLLAPAGYGKTTLLSEWVHERMKEEGERMKTERNPIHTSSSILHPFKFAWVSLDERDNTPERFWCYVLEALRAIDQDLPTGWDTSSDLAHLWSEDVLIELINLLSSEAREDFVLILDDFHLITNPTILAAMDLFLSHLPPCMHLVISRRSEIPLQLAQLRARDQIVELRAADLRFTQEEAHDFLTRMKGLKITASEVETLSARAEGWIAGLQLAALSLRDAPDSEAFIRDFAGTHRFIGDYLAEQVLLQQPQEIQTFLLQTSILGRLTGSLCEALTRRLDGKAVLEQLEAENLFLVPLDNQGYWYRYHHLFADFLRSQLQKTYPELVQVLHRRAARWCESNGLTEDAVQHALEAKDYDLAACLIIRFRDTVRSDSRIQTMLGWMRALPEEMVRSRPQLCLGYAWMCALSGQFNEVESLLRPVRNYLNQILRESSRLHGVDEKGNAPGLENGDCDLELRDNVQSLMVDVDILQAFLARFSPDIAQTMVFAHRALAHLPADGDRERAIAQLFTGHAQLLLGDDREAEQSLQAAMSLSRGEQGVTAYLSALNYLAQLRILQGQLEEAFALYRHGLQFVEAQPLKICTGIERIGLGDLLRERNDLENGARYIEEGLRLAEIGGDFVFLRDGYLAYTRLCMARRDQDGAMQAIRKAESITQRNHAAWDTVLVQIWKTRLLMAFDDLKAAEAAAHDFMNHPQGEVHYVKELGQLTAARLLYAQGRLHEAQRLLSELQAKVKDAGRAGRLIEILVLQALVAQENGQIEQGLECLQQALTLAKQQAYMRVFLDEGKPMDFLLARLSGTRLNDLQEYVNRLLSAGGKRMALAGMQTSVRWGTLVGKSPLSERELQVLKLIEAGMTYQQIAEELVIALSTVQTHVKNVYSKLDAHSGLEAVARARHLKLLSQADGLWIAR